MLSCTNTRSEDAAFEGQGFKPLCLSTPIICSRAVQLVHHGERLARLSDCAAHPAGHTRTKTKDSRPLDCPGPILRNTCSSRSGPRKAGAEFTPRHWAVRARTKLSCLAKGLHTRNRCRCC